MKFATKLIHSGQTIDPRTGALGMPIYQTSTFRQQSVDNFGKYDYARSDNPSREALEEAVAELEGGTRGFAFASGMAAISSTLLIFSPGDHLVVCDDVYGGAYRVLTGIFARLGITSTFVDATSLEAIEGAIRPETKGIYLETPSNPLLKVTDLAAVARLARARNIITLVDNTFMTPYLQRPLELGCDIVLHSGTKFMNGHSDVICGFAVVKDADLGQRIRFIQNGFGAILGPQDSFLTMRGLKTLKIRMDQSQQSAMAIVEWLSRQEQVTRIHYPGCPEHPGHAVHMTQADGPGAVFSFELDSFETTRRLLEGARYSAFAVSLGGVESILSYPARMSHAAVPPEERLRKGITDTLVRLSVGLEDPDDLIADLAAAFDRRS
ncbi:PLP-dependent aspartate aminotransferase family protein [Geobacter sp. SVR]|uniref:trans-sulfuration enzyme family protein n=1 Tax=Geobacter sp. SVR TaxID=2495594 RepID=UPI00143EFC07|nr:aminotransferase class I/II-fold pyridoxal phosphate-dependent enzyme [Geobacter sp. SVR]BCS54861.1 cystathionine gamma-synthase [Geobacter sp. SVR]GCF87379.1 cystathionine gamma-synthase [Geobacter sp. SVR]